MFTLIVFVGGWFLGRYWDQVNEIVKDKLNQSKKSDGGVTRISEE